MKMPSIALLALGAVLVVFPFVASDYLMVLAHRVLMYSLIVLSFSLLVSQLGLVSLLQTTFAGLGGYAVAILAVLYGWSWPAALFASLGVVLASALLFGLVSLRASGIGFMMLTIALGQMVWALSFQWIDLTKGMDGITGVAAPIIAGLDLGNARSMYLVTAIIVVAAFAASHVLVSSHFGLLLRGIQDNAPRMRALAHPVLRARLVLFVIASLFAGIGGILLTWETRVITPVTLDLSRAVWVLTAAVVGGTRSLLGVPLGVILMVTLEAVLSQYTDRHLMIFGVVLVLSILLLPNGIAAFAADLWARRHGPTRAAMAQ